MKWMGIALVIIAGFAAGIWILGRRIPVQHVAARAAHFSRSPETIWETLTNLDAMPSWRSDLKGLKRLPDADGKPAWIETTRFGDLPLEVVESEPPRRLVTRISNPDLSFGGMWIFEIQPDSEGATLRITERGEIRSSLFRVMTRYFFGYTSTIETYLNNLAAKYGESATIHIQ
jgi:hypothetical protein